MAPLLMAFVLAATPEVAVLSSAGDTAELRFQPLGATTLSAPVARFTHADGSEVHGALLPGTRVVVASATLRSGGDVSFANALLRLEAGKPARVLAEALAYGSRPLVSAEGRVYVSRGHAGPTLDGEARVDALTVDEIDPITAKTRTVYATRGFVTFLVGALGREVIIYEVNALGGRLLAVHGDTLAVRPILPSMVPMARDFVLDAPRKRVLFTQLDPSGQGWSVEETSLVDGASRTRASGPEVTLLPTVRLDGRVLISKGEGLGLISLDGGEGLAAQGRGFDRVISERRDGLLFVSHEVPSDFPSLLALRGKDRVPLLTPPQARLSFAGVTP